MALSGDRTIESRPGWHEARATVVDGQTVFKSALVAVNHRNHATAADRGKALPFSAANLRIPFGVSTGQAKTGSNTVVDPLTNQLPAVKLAIDRPVVLLEVSGLAGTPADTLREVWATDDGTYTLTRSAKAALAGYVVIPHTTTRAWVALVLGLDQLLTQRAVSRYSWCLGQVSGNQSASGVVKTGLVAPHHGRVLEVYAYVVQPLSGAGASITWNLRNGAVDFSGGVVTTVLADAQGARKSGTAVTDDPANYFHEGDDLRIVATVGTASTAGLIEFWATVQTEQGN